jgi:hypothetical protein
MKPVRRVVLRVCLSIMACLLASVGQRGWRPQRDKVITLMISLDEYQVKQIRRFEQAVA